MNVQANQHVTPFEQFAEPNATDQLGASILSAKQAQEPIQQPAPMPQQIPTQAPVNNQVIPENNAGAVPPVNDPVVQPIVNNTQAVIPVTPEPAGDAGQLGGGLPVTDPVTQPEAVIPEGTKPEANGPKTDQEFDDALAELEKELGLDVPQVPGTEPEAKDGDGDKDIDIQKGLERDKKFLKIIDELDSTNKKSLTRAGELEVKLDTATTQMEYYKQQAQGYYEELRGNEFDRSKFEVTPDAKNFVHYFNEFKDNKDNVQARDSALREAIKIVNGITGRDLNNYLADYFTMGTANLGELQGGARGMPSNFNKTPGVARGADSQKRSAIGNALSNM